MKLKHRLLALLTSVAMLFNMTACSDLSKESDHAKGEAALSNQQEEKDYLDTAAEQLLAMVSEPKCGSVGGDWTTFGLSRWGGALPENWQENYYKLLEDHIAECGGILDERKYTEYSRTILVLTAIGKDPENVHGYNLLEALANFERTTFQGLNGPIYALLALDSGNYEIPENTTGTTQATRELYVDYILDKEAANGGWSLAGGSAEIDITAMALQALAKYQDREDVAAATERGLTFLSQQQNEHGGYTAYGADGSESVSQVIVALAELGISIDDQRFVKNGRTLKDRLMDFEADEQGFKHLLDDESANLLATEQAFYALVALDRVQRGESSLYRIVAAA